MDEFINECKKIYRNKYTYDNVNFISLEDDIIITCNRHGDFIKTPINFIEGDECSKCISSYKKKSTEDFIIDSIKIHKDEYDYSLSNYINYYTKIKIICKKHGVFEQKPSEHLKGHGCINCYCNKRKTTEQFIKESKEKHGDRYNYDKVDYINSNTKVTITCHTHGDFEQTAKHHLQGMECSQCAGNKKKTTEEFIEDCKKTHGNKYDYSLVEYINCNTPVRIKCLTHGTFDQPPSLHLAGKGCYDCGLEKFLKCNKKRKTTEQFIKESKEKHGDVYIYDKTEYINNYTKVTITCKIHGDFQQTPTMHLRNKGCSSCNGGRKKTKEEFIENSRKIHGDRYDYSLVEYIKATLKVKILCNEHGVFEQTPKSHVQGTGCPTCGRTKKKNT